jgi:purine-binding chemotaxis protein CheW
MDTVIFTIAGKKYGINIKQVLRVIRLQEIITVPDSSPLVAGVINLRGKVVPLISLRFKFCGERAETKKNDRIMISSIREGMVGFLADDVLGVFNIQKTDMAPPNEVLRDAHYLEGVARVKDDLVLIVDAEKIISTEEEKGIRGARQITELNKKDG